MSVYVRIRNGMMPDGEGNGGASEGDIRGNSNDFVEAAGVVDLAGGHLLVHEADTPAMEIVVDEGVGYIPNTSFDELDSDSIKFWEAVVAGIDAERTLAIDANSSGQTRIDLVCLKIDPGASPDYYASDVAELIIVKGTPGAGAPATPSYHLKLAEVTVVNGATEIENADIADSRVQVVFKDELMPANVMKTDEVQTVTEAKTFNSGKLLATRPKITTSIDDAAGAQVIKTPSGEQMEVARGSFQGLQVYTPDPAGTATLDLALGNDHRIQMPAGNITIAISNAKVGQKFLVSITQDGVGSRTVTWFGTIRWVDGVTPTLTTTLNKRDTFAFVVTGAGTYDGFIVGQNI